MTQMRGTFPPSFLDEVRERTSLVSIISPYSKLVKKGREYSGLCPFHQEKSPSFTVNDDKGVYYCFGCGASGNVFDFLKDKMSMNFPEAVTYLAERAGIPLPQMEQVSPEEHDARKNLWDALEAATQYFESCLQDPTLGKSAREYLERRQIQPTTQSHFRVGYAPPAKDFMAWTKRQQLDLNVLEKVGLVRTYEDGNKGPWFHHRIIFPILNPQGKVIAFGGRVLGDQKPKYLNSPETALFNKRRVLYGLPYAQNRGGKKAENVFVVEGYMDAISLADKGIQGAVAPLGTALSEEQMQILWRSWDSPVLCFDGDLAGRKAAFRSVERMLPQITTSKTLRVALLPEGQDPDDFIKVHGIEKWKSFIKQALSIDAFLPEEVIQASAPKGLKNASSEVQASIKKHLSQLSKMVKDVDLSRAFEKKFLGVFYEKLRYKAQKSMKNQLHMTHTEHQAKRRCEWLIVSAFFHFPWLLEEKLSQFENYEFQDQGLAELVPFFFQYLEEENSLEKENLITYLKNYGQGIWVEKFQDPKLLAHGRFLFDATSPEILREGWQKLWDQLVTLPEAENDLKSAEEQMAKDMTPEAWERVQNLKAYLDEVRTRVQDIQL